ncbi:MAG: hypothetical protein JO138_23355 [Acidobacteriaceae bacterium]|nr:hypothetical protein [Acidobacteriaceae bacterium]
MQGASAAAQQLVAEMLWALLLFPSNIRPKTKRQQVRDIWALSGQQVAENHPDLSGDVLIGVGSGGPGFNTYRPNELTFLIVLVRDLKQRNESERRNVLTDYDAFFDWVNSVPREGYRQFRHMLRFFAFPDRVERISSNADRRKILEAFDVASSREIRNWSDRALDDALMALRTRLQGNQPTDVLDFYEPPLKERWLDRKVRTPSGEVTVVVPEDDDEQESKNSTDEKIKSPQARQSIQVQSKLAEIGAIMGFKIWIPSRMRKKDPFSFEYHVK